MAAGPTDPEALAQDLFEIRRVAAQLDIARQTLADRLATVEARVHAEAARMNEDTRSERDRAVEQRDAAFRDRDIARSAQHDAEAMLARVTGSTAWRLTAPIRLVMICLLGRPR